MRTAGRVRSVVIAPVLGVLVVTSCEAPRAQHQGPAVRQLSGGSVPVAEIERFVPEVMKKTEVAGLSIAVIDHGRVAYAHAFGVKDAAKGEAPDTQTVFAGASFSKPLFAYLVMLLVEDGTLDLDRPLAEYLGRALPEVHGYADLAGDERWRQITARRVLSHTTGLVNWRFLSEDGRLSYWFEPGTRFSYSGEGIVLLQRVVERVTGTGLEALARARVFDPLGMTRTSYVWQESWEANHAVPHDQWGRPRKLQRRSEADAAGSLFTTAEDYGRFVAALLAAKGPRRRTVEAMMAPQVRIVSERMFGPGARRDTSANDGIKLSWGLGWGRFDSPYGRAFFHIGHDIGWQNYTVTYLDAGLGIVMLSNSDAFESIAEELAGRIIRDVYSPYKWLGYERFDPVRKGTPPATPKVIEVAAERLAPLAGTYRFRDKEFEVALDAGHLRVRSGPEAPWAAMLPISESEFLVEDNDLHLAFERGEKGSVVRMVLVIGDARISCPRVP
jgi:CubicO group peptidase (beta-lactamase class C family)